MKDKFDVIIVGAGASGILCGILLAEAGISTLLIEKNKSMGKKLSATGNGRCNFTNLQMDSSHYYADKVWLDKVLAKYAPEDAIRQFADMGVLARERDGYVYPHTNQAATVVEALHNQTKKDDLSILLETKVKDVKKKGDEFVVSLGSRSVRSKYLVLATGGKASEELGGSGSGYQLARKLGHTVNDLYPALTGLKAEGKQWKAVAGTRIQGRFSLLTDDRKREGEIGEIQIVKDGVSGIPVFQMCRVAAENLAKGKRVEGVIDFVPSLNEKQVEQWVSTYGIDGLVPKKWVSVLQTGKTDIKNYRFRIQDTFGMERAQVTAGGVDTNEVDAETMQSGICKNLFLLGEMLDVDGRCGGYNLHFAWATANLSAKELIRQIKER